jgi:uncharacterized protein (DUF952 family)
MIYHITSRTAWNQARQRGDYRAESLETEGFIHCSTDQQVIPVAEKYYKDQKDLILLVIEPDRLTSDLRWEPPSEGSLPPGVPEGALFPHIYGPINLEAVVRVLDLQSHPDGGFKFPKV